MIGHPTIPFSGSFQYILDPSWPTSPTPTQSHSGLLWTCSGPEAVQAHDLICLCKAVHGTLQKGVNMNIPMDAATVE